MSNDRLQIERTVTATIKLAAGNETDVETIAAAMSGMRGPVQVRITSPGPQGNDNEPNKLIITGETA